MSGRGRALQFAGPLVYDAFEMDIPWAPIMKTRRGPRVLALPLAAAGRPAGAADKPHKLADAVLAAIGSEREPGAGVLVLKDGQVVYLGVARRRGHAGHASDRRPDRLPPGLGHETVHRHGGDAARPRRQAPLRGQP